MVCPICEPRRSGDFDVEAVLECAKCFSSHAAEFESVDEFEKNLVSSYQWVAEEVLEADRLFMKSLPKKVSKKQQKRNRVFRLNEINAAVGRETLEKRQKLSKPPKNPVVTLSLSENNTVEKYKLNAGHSFHPNDVRNILRGNQ